MTPKSNAERITEMTFEVAEMKTPQLRFEAIEMYAALNKLHTLCREMRNSIGQQFDI